MSVFAHLVESRQILQQKMLQHASAVDISRGIPLPAAVLLLPCRILLCPAPCLLILKIRDLFPQNRKIAGLVDIELCRHKRPDPVIHPHARNLIAIGDKGSLLASDNGRIGSVDADTLKIIEKHLAHTVRIHQKKCQTVLPEISPASSSLSVIMVRQKGTAIDPAQDRLKADPLHIAVKLAVFRVVGYVYFLFPVCFHALIRRLRLRRRAVRCRHA